MGEPSVSGPPAAMWPLSTVSPTGTVAAAGGPRVAYYEFGGGGPPLVLVHATGFCAAALRPMADAVDGGMRCLGLDLRAHGASARPRGDDFSWTGFADDVLALVDQLGLEHPYGFGHSCGGAAILLAEQSRPGTFAGLFCYEPVIYPGDVPLEPAFESNPLAEGALRRRQRFSDRHAALQNFSSRPPLDVLDPAVLAAYVDNGFEADPDGGIRLRCRRQDEARIYAHGFSHDAYARLGDVTCPVTLACGAETDAFGPPFLELFAERLADVEQMALPGLGHFGPLQDPRRVATAVADSRGVDGAFS
ncbi:MAG TPA: alpha/beta hydrolase [Acidimicrobiales bacterium]|nr:alpha/beta hydrolase [Acidimicrobiales bacterium]